MKPDIEISVEGKTKGKYDEWFLKDACRTLLEAEEIKNDPKLMKALKPMLAKKARAYKSLAELRKMGNQMAYEEDTEDDDD